MFAQHPHQHRHRRRAAVALTAVLVVGTGSAAAMGQSVRTGWSTVSPAVGGPTTTNPYAVKKPLVAVAPATVRRLNRVTITLTYFPARSRVTVGIYDTRNRLWMYRDIIVNADGKGTGTVMAPAARGTYTVQASVARPAVRASTMLFVV